jgi:hypothetical protein
MINIIKKLLGIVWMLVGPSLLCLLINGAIININADGEKDINKPLPWIIIITIFTPIAVGFTIFGWYAYSGAYNKLPAAESNVAVAK